MNSLERKLLKKVIFLVFYAFICEIICNFEARKRNILIETHYNIT